MGRTRTAARRTGAALALLALVASTLVASTLVAPRRAAADPGDPDPSFGGGDGRVVVDSGHDVAPWWAEHVVTVSDGTFVWGTGFLGEVSQKGVIRYDSDGQRDPVWNDGAPLTVKHFGNEQIRIDADSSGRLLVLAGTRLIRYSATGRLDTTFSGDGQIDLIERFELSNLDIVDLAVRADGVIVLAGSHSGLDSGSFVILQITPSGQWDTAFSDAGVLSIPKSTGPGAGPDSLRDLELAPDGDIFVLGDRFFNGPEAYVIAATATGQPVSGFGVGGMAQVPPIGSDLLLDATGHVVLRSLTGPWRVARLTHAGVIDPSMGAPYLTVGDSSLASGWDDDATTVGDLALIPARRLTDDGWKSAVARLQLDVLTLDPTFGPGGDDGPGVVTLPTLGGDALRSAAELGSGAIVVASSYDIARLSPTGEVDTTFGDGGHTPIGVARHRQAEARLVRKGPGGSYLVGGQMMGGGVFLAWHTSTGAPQPGFGSEGRVELEPSEDRAAPWLYDLIILEDGRLAVLYAPDEFASATVITVLDSTGDPDPGFGVDGTVTATFNLPDGRTGRFTSLAASGSADDAQLYAAGGWSGAGSRGIVLEKLLVDGSLDSTYGTDGRAFALVSDVSSAPLVAVDADGSATWAVERETESLQRKVTLGRVSANGQIDSAFGGIGAVDIVAGAARHRLLTLHRPAAGGLDVLLSRPSEQTAVAVRLTAAGTLDPGHGVGGIATLASVGGGMLLAATRSGERALFLQRSDSAVRLLGLNGAGLPDASLGPGGVRVLEATAPSEVIGDPRPVLVGGATSVVLALAVDAAGPGELPGTDVVLAKILTEPTAPGAPTAVSAVPGDELATVSWTPPAKTGGVSITGYTVTASPGGAACTAPGATTACTVTGLTNGQEHTFTVRATNSVGSGPWSSASAAVTPDTGKGALIPLPAPQRIVDSRSPNGDTIDEQQERFGALPAGTTRTIPVAGRAGLPTDTTNVVLTVTAVGATGTGHLTIYPCGTPRPLASSMNYSRGTTIANTIITKLGTTGTHTGNTCVYTNTTTHLVIDVTGAISPAALDALPAPQRIVDSRSPNGDTIDEQQERFGALPAGTTRTIPVAGRAGLPTDTTNVVLTVTAVGATGTGHLTIYPCGTPRPLASSMNYSRGTTIANTITTKLGTTGTHTGNTCVYTNTTTHLVIDVTGAVT